MTELPSGTVTFLISDVERATRLLDRHGDAMVNALERHEALNREVVQANGGMDHSMVTTSAAAGLPTGLVTFLFTDVEGSTRLWQQYRESMGPALARHDELVQGLVAQHGGTLVRPRGEGDSRFAVFARASDAVAAACAIQVALIEESWALPDP